MYPVSESHSKVKLDEFDLLVSETLDGEKDQASTHKLGTLLQDNKELQKDFLDQLWMHQLLSEYYRTSPTGEIEGRTRLSKLETITQVIGSFFRPLRKLASFDLN